MESIDGRTDPWLFQVYKWVDSGHVVLYLLSLIEFIIIVRPWARQVIFEIGCELLKVWNALSDHVDTLFDSKLRRIGGVSHIMNDHVEEDTIIP